jgi:protein-tyrosine phosphatase
MKVLMVCLGNICRSPLAEGILQSKVDSKNLKWVVDSAGTSNYHPNSKPDSRSIQVAKENGVDISNQRARQIKQKDIEEFDLIFAMDYDNYENILDLCKNKNNIDKVKLILNEINPGEDKGVPDPYYGDITGFREVFKMLNEACDKIIENYA